MSETRILMVCTGNSCRSVMAQGLLQQKAKQAGVATIKVESAGVFAVQGMEPTQETQHVLRGVGVDCSMHRARSLTVEMVEHADLILVMETFQAEELLRRMPQAKAKVHLLKEYAGMQDDPNLNVPDPIGKPMEVYEVCFASISDAVERIAHGLGLKAS